MPRKPDSLTIRPASISDARSLYEFASRVFHETFAPDNTPEDMDVYMASAFSLERQQQELLDPKRTTYLIFEREALAGYLQFFDGPVESCVRGDRPLEIARCYVDGRWQGGGVASMLLAHGLDQARSRGYKTVWLGVWERNFRAQKFYLKSGFKRVGEHIFQMGNDPQTDWILARQLP